jgi:hypothetical protein
MSREAMQMALEALESDPLSHAGLVSRKQAIAVLRQALETEQEPVLWLKTWSDGSVSVLKTKSHAFADHELKPLYTEPPKREWVGLTDGEIDILSCEMVKGYKSVNWLCKVLEAKLKEKNA